MLIRDFKHAWRVANEMSLVVKWHDPGETGGLIYVLQNQKCRVDKRRIKLWYWVTELELLSKAMTNYEN